MGDIRVCVSVVVIRDGRVLLVHRGPRAPFDVGKWTAPTGGIEPGDHNVLAAATRELYEETGVVLFGGQIVDVVDGLVPRQARQGVPRFVTMVVRGTCVPYAVPDYRRDPSHDAVEWFDAEHVPDDTWDRALLLRLLGQPQVERDAPRRFVRHGQVTLARDLEADRVHGCYFPSRDLVVSEMGGRGTGMPDGVDWLDPVDDLLASRKR